MEINNPADAIKYLKSNWSGQDGGPIKTVELLVRNSGYFEIPHLLMTYIEYLSGLFSGKGPDVQYSDVREFFNAYFPSKYLRPSAWLIYLYRHGLVHQYEPKTIKLSDGKIIGWHCSLDNSDVTNHLEIIPHYENQQIYHLRINGPEFLKDFKNAICIFSNDLLNNSNRFQNFEEGYKKYKIPIAINEIKKPYISEEDMDWLKNLNNRKA